MSLTVSEKTHWKERITKRIDQRIETLIAKQDPTLLQRVTEQSRERSYASLGIASQQQELEQIKKRREELDKRERRLKAEQRAAIKSTPLDEELDSDHWRYDTTVEQAVKTRATAFEADELAETDLGKQVLALREEKENLLDTVWLATSSTQIKQLWEQVNALLERTPTALEEKALTIPPDQEASASQ